MKNHKFIELTPHQSGPFFRYLQFLAQKKNWPWDFATHPHYDPEFFADASAVIVDPTLSSLILPQLQTLTASVRGMEVLDCFLLEGGRWYPRILSGEAIKRVLVQQARDLDNRAPAFVVGDDEMGRVAASVLSEIGYSQIFLVGDEAKLQRQKVILSRSQLGLDFQVMPPEDLPLQAVSAGLVVNVKDLTKNRAVFTDLSYFNYMKVDGYVLDLNLYPIHNILLDEAGKAGLRALSPVMVMEEMTMVWAQWLKFDDVLSANEIRETWKSFLQENPSSV